jgi:oligoribonuclease NrnB/cAMP/cGMP phosphodiesterase (DHH superfamily)
MKCFYHKADADGKCSAAIIKMAHPDAQLMAYNYGDKFPWESIKPGEPVFMVDVSLQPSEMDRLNKVSDLTWIDHHASLLSTIDPDIKGLRRVGSAGCELTWEFLHGSEEVPLAVTYIGRYDVWDKSDEELWDEKLVPLTMGLRGRDIDPNGLSFWEEIFGKPEAMNKIIEAGKAILGYQKEQHKSHGEESYYEGTFAGKKAVFGNTTRGSEAFEGFFDPKKHDLMVSYEHTKDKQWRVSLYSDKVDVSALAKKFGGGGHKGASGFMAKDLSFIDS